MTFSKFASFRVKLDILNRVASALGPGLLLPTDPLSVAGYFSAPPTPEAGDLSLPCFSFAKTLKSNPAQIAQKIKMALEENPLPALARFNVAGPYINFFLQRDAYIESVLALIQKHQKQFVESDHGKGQTIVIDFSSPNIAKHLAFHHLRSTVIGHSLRNIFSTLGYRVIAINHLGDWGTQFGKLMVAYKKWGKKDLGDDPVGALNALYVQFQKESKENPALLVEARAVFQQLESGEPQTKELWGEFRKISLEVFDRVYQRLGVSFDVVRGESYFIDQIDGLLKRLNEQSLSKISEGALIVDLSAYKMPPCLLKKGDETTLYATRDLCAAIDRHREYQFNRMLYVVDQGQSLHFQQVMKVLELMGETWAERLEHVSFGIIKFGGTKTRTREGGIILLEDVLDQAQKLILEKIKEKNPNLANAEKTAEMIGVGAIIFADLSGRRRTDINFDWDAVLNFDGQTGPYVQYSHARACSILKKGGDFSGANVSLLKTEAEWQVVKVLAAFPESLLKAAHEAEPSLVADEVLKICEAFHRYHAAGKSDPAQRVLVADNDELKKARLLLTDCCRIALAAGLNLLGLQAPEEM